MDIRTYSKVQDDADVESSHRFGPHRKLSNSCSRRKIFAVIISAFFAATTLTALVIAIHVRNSPIPGADERRLTLNDLFDPAFATKYFSYQWLQGDSYTYVKGDILKYNIAANTTSILVDKKQLEKDLNTTVSLSTYTVTTDEKYVLIAVKTKKLWRHSYFANYIVYDVATKAASTFSQDNLQIRNLQVSPGTNIVAFVRNDNIFVKFINTNQEVQVTNNGPEEHILNGVMSWVYEESNESEVPVFSFPYYNLEDPYTQNIDVRYPKAGFTNPSVQLGIYDVQMNVVSWVDLSNQSFEYITYVTWHDSNHLLLKTMKRAQTSETTLYYDVEKSSLRLIQVEKDNRWLDTRPVTFVEDCACYITIQERDDFNHIAKWNLNGTFVGFLTGGPWDVTAVASYVARTNTVYYISTEESPTERHLYSISAIDGSQKQKLTSGDAWYDVSFSSSGDYFVLYYGGPSIPYQQLNSTNDPEFGFILEDNHALNDTLSQLALPTKSFVHLQVASNLTLNAYLIYPPSFSKFKKYPLFVQVYGGPSSQAVMKTFDKVTFGSYISSQFDCIVAGIDGRGTFGQGNNFMKQVLKQLGKLETEDQIAGIDVIRKTYDYVEQDNIGIWGWSYGGFMTLSVVGSNSTNVKFGMSVAPVTDWRLYDTFYTEKYMKTPEENAVGYKSTAIGNHMDRLGDHRLLLVHGTGDDNVHFQNSVNIVELLIEKGMQFETMYYPNRQHDISGNNARQHLYQLLSNFVMKKLEE